jgi:hypothetical protein
LKDGPILALDLSKSIGWCCGKPGDPMPKWGVWLLPIGSDFGRIFNAFENCILDAFDEFQPLRVAVERPIPQRTNNVFTAELTYGLHAVLALHCHRHDLPLARPSVDTIRAKVCGRSRLTALERAVRPRLNVKAVIVEPWCASMGWQEISNDDARDAAAVWSFECGYRAPRPTKFKRAA